MKLEQNRIDDLNLQVTITVAAEDYADSRKKRLNDFRKKAEIKGFRKGMVPASLVEKMYGQQALVDSVNDVIAESLNNFIQENSLRVLGEPLPTEEQQSHVWEAGNEFTFSFDIAENPEVSFELSKEDEVVYYTITVTEAAKKEMKDNLLRQYGSLEEGEAAKEDDFIIVDFEQGDMKVEGTYVALRNVAEAARASFVGVKVGDVLDVNVNEAFENETDRASMLKVSKDELATLDPMFKMTVKNVKTFVPAALTEETFEKVFGVKTEAEFDAKIEERIRAEYAQEADFRFSKDAKTFLLEKANVQVAEKFLKRWVYTVNEGKFTMEDIEKDFESFLKMFTWNYIQRQIITAEEIKVSADEAKAEAKSLAAAQFAQYGMPNAPEEMLENFSKNILENKEQNQKIYEKLYEQKVVESVKAKVKVTEKAVSAEEFAELAKAL